MLDGYWPVPPLKEHKNLVIVHTGVVVGMRDLINAGARMSTSKYIMKLDAHCMVSPGFDEELKKNCEYDWVSVPSRYSLEPEAWVRDLSRRAPTDYLMLTFPYKSDNLYGTGLHGRKWKGPGGKEGSFFYLEDRRKDIKIDDIITFQGSCWFMHRDKYFDVDGLETEGYGRFHQEAQELGFKIWLSGGRVIRNKNCWYAHLHKGNRYGRGFRLSKPEMVKSEVYSFDMWMNNKWPKQTRDFKWLIDKFPKMDGWPDDWFENLKKYQEEYVHPRADLL